MLKSLSASVSLLAILGTLLVAGCETAKHDDMKSDSMMKKDGMAMDACSHCPGVQTATADGKCPMCGMAVMNMAK